MTDEEEIEQARRQWRARFRARVEAIVALMESTPEDNTPTPQAIEDGEHR